MKVQTKINRKPNEPVECDFIYIENEIVYLYKDGKIAPTIINTFHVLEVDSAIITNQDKHIL